MSDEITPPPVFPSLNPVASEQPEFMPPPPASALDQPYLPPWERPPEPKKKKGAKKAGPIAAAFLALLAKLKAIGMVLLTFLKFAKLGKIALTAGSMLVSIWLYAQIFGAWFAVGFVVLIFVHEMGHVWAAYKMGIPVSAPIFIPFMGALILTKKFGNKLITHDAIIGIGGPILGTVGSAACAGIYMVTGSVMMLALAYTGFFLNLFNLTPIYPLDGGWIVRAISPILWLVGMVVLGYLVITGTVRNPLIFILVILGLPTMWTELRAFFKRIPSPVPTAFRWKMGVAYVTLMGVCVVGMSACDNEINAARSRQQRRTTSSPAVALNAMRHESPAHFSPLIGSVLASAPSALRLPREKPD
ncbi:MAG: site-2 protease family protein [Fimbriimonadaceae bacterium]